jgi:hypothetical protein
MRSSVRTETILTVQRRCLVCEQLDEGEELDTVDPIGVPCSSCHAPTERIGILARRRRSVAVNPHAAALGRLGGLKGGPARANALSGDERSAIARRAARKRWGYKD